MICSAPAHRYARCGAFAAMAPPLSAGCSTRIHLSSNLDEGGTDDFGNGQRLDPGHFPEPDLLTARKVRGIDGGVIVRDFLQCGDLDKISCARCTADIGFDRVVDLLRRVGL